MINNTQQKGFPYESLLILPFYVLMLISADSQASRFTFNLAALYCLYWLIRREKKTSFSPNASTLLGIVFIAYLALSSLWSGTQFDATYLRWGLGLGMFWLSISIVMTSPSDTLETTAKALILISTATALYSVTYYFLSPDAPARNEGPGMTHHPILGPSVLIAVGATAVAILQYCHRFSWGLFSILLASLLAYTLTSGSRGPLLSLGIWTGLLVVSAPITLRTKSYILASCSLAGLIVLGVFIDFFLGLLERGTTYRIDIWRATIDLIKESPLFGKGIGYSFMESKTSQDLELITGFRIEHPHNLGLSTWLYSGFTGIAMLFLTTISGAFILTRKHKQKALVFLLPLLGCLLFLSLTDLNRLVEAPSPIWFIFWFPFACISGLSARKEHPIQRSRQGA